ncbi:EAL domain-containing protein [uncultured Oxalicibacterium sp.]|uniref:putative bifunctional diguanylate cyclase/phosphodiesterase n=1 Tax=uncultured Oxalicibacterium sp. TaxID=1168540 RepID=UPI0025D81D20|nr:EAL domain-containing protein [uncultured Oxalicibacterium sp.]
MGQSFSHPSREVTAQRKNGSEAKGCGTIRQPGWHVLIVGADADFHSAMSFALTPQALPGTALHFLHAHSTWQATQLPEQATELAVILLDALSLDTHEIIELIATLHARFNDARLIIRTSEEEKHEAHRLLAGFDIHAWLIGREIDRSDCADVFGTALHAYRQARALHMSNRGLEKILQANRHLPELGSMEEFATAVLRFLSDLLAVPEDGLICIRETLHNAQNELFVVAATGSFTELINHPASNFEPAMHKAVLQAVEQRNTVHTGEFTALYFAGEASRCLVALLRNPRVLDEIETRLLEVFCSTVSIGLTNILLVTRLHSSAFYDSLTNLPNRERLKEILDETLRQPVSLPTTLALIDIDHFAETNDTLGHQFGDHLLLAVAARLQSRLGHHLIVARVSGDTFAVLGDDMQITPDAIFAQFERPFGIDAQQVQLSATVGLLRLAEHEGSGAEALKNAQIALKRAKLQQRAGHLYFSRNMGVDIRERVNMMHALRQAFEDKQLYVVYQPQIDLRSGEAVGAEALLRWCNEDGMMISPARFIPIAEYSGLIVELGEWVLRQACLETVHLSRNGFTHFMISINVSQVQFRHPQFLAMLERTLYETQAVPHCIELEITESMAMEDPDALIKLLDRVMATGVSVAIDDFGTGFSSMSHLQKLNVDRLKIDRAFVSEITDSARGSSIAEAIIQLGRNLELDVIAEGVENEEQADILSQLGCAYGQGYLFAGPLTADRLDEWLRRNRNTCAARTTH